jgi:hypothetical protein
LPSVILGILAVIFVALRKREFEKGREGMGMESGGSDRSGLPTAGGILSIIVGAFEVIGGGIMVGVVGPSWVSIVGVPVLVLGIIAIVGGVSAIGRKNFGLSLAGAICALLSVPLGIVAIVFVSLSKREFEGERKENGI